MTDLTYHITNPENHKPTYSEYDNIDFKVSFLGRSLVGGSVRLIGDVLVTDNLTLNPDGNPPANLNRVMYDGFLGAHTFIDTLTTSFNNSGMIENIRFYPRFCSAKAKASLAKEDLFNSMYVCEGRTPSDQHADLILKGYALDSASADIDPDRDNGLTRRMDFAVKLDNCLNNFVGDNILPYTKTGDIILSMTVPRSVSVLYGGEDIGLTQTLQFSNLRLVYSTVADDGKNNGKHTMRVKTDLKQTIASTNATIATKAPIVADSMFLTFIKQSDENVPLVNGMENQRLPLVARVEFAWNDSLSQQYRYELDNEEEILSNYIKAINASMVAENNAGLNVLASNDGYGMGLSFGSFVDLSQSKISIRIESEVSNAVPFTAYLFFSGITTL
jgi:hypothetical protein